MLNDAQRLGQQELIAIYDEYSTPLYRYAYRLLGDADIAEECVAETFSRFLAAVKGGKGPREQVKAYLYRIAHNLITDFYRKVPLEPLDPDLNSGQGDNPAVVVTRSLELERLRRALLHLTAEQRQVITLRFLENWAHEEVAALIGKSVEATRALQSRALAALRHSLREQEA